MDAVTALTMLGGVATGDCIIARSWRKRLRSAVRRQEITRLSRGRYALAGAASGRAAAQLHGVRSHTSAALHHGWAVKAPPVLPHVTVRRGRRISTADRRWVVLHRRDLDQAEVERLCTAPLRTVLDCAKDLPFDEALAVADSALREGAVTGDRLRAAAVRLRGPNGARARRVARYADPRAANPFESVLRALAIEAGLDVVPQHPVTCRLGVRHPVVVDVGRRLAIEAESWEHHGDLEAFERDCRRYTAFVVAGWRVLRFTWTDVMGHPDYVLEVLRAAAVVGPSRHPKGTGSRHRLA